MRCVLAWNDLPAFAKPTGFHQIAHEYECGNGHDAHCAHTWLYTSADRTYNEAITDLRRRYRAEGWTFSACSGRPDTCSIATKGKDEDCLFYADFEIGYEHRKAWRTKFQKQIDSSVSTLVITRGCV